MRKSDYRFELMGEAASGKLQLKSWMKNIVDVVITDIIMQSMDGLALLRYVVEKYPRAYVVLMSGLQDFKFAREGLIYGACDYLVKPVCPEQLQQALTRVYGLLESGGVNRYAKDILSEAIGEICKRIISQGNISEDAISNCAMQIRNTPNFLLLDDISALKLGLRLGLERLFNEYTKIDMVLVADILVRKHWTAEEDGMVCCIKSVHGIEKIYQHLVLPDIQHKLVRETVSLVLGEMDIKKTVENIAQILHVNRSYLSTVFRSYSGINLLEYLIRVKMYQARLLLVKLELPIAEVAELLGYEDDEYFSKLFKSHAGMLPREYRKMILREF